MRLSRLSAAAVLSASVALAPVAPALAATHGHHHATSTRVHTRAVNNHAKAHERLAGPRRGAEHAVAVQLKVAEHLLGVAENSSGVADVDRADLVGAAQADVAAVQSDASAVANATSFAEIRSAVHAAVGTHLVEVAQVNTVVSAGEVRAQIAAVQAQVDAVQAQVTQAAQAGQDTTVTQGDLDAATAALTDAGAQVDAAVAQVLALSPTAARSDLHAALVAAQGDLDAASADLVTASGSLSAAQQALNPA